MVVARTDVRHPPFLAHLIPLQARYSNPTGWSTNTDTDTDTASDSANSRTYDEAGARNDAEQVPPGSGCTCGAKPQRPSGLAILGLGLLCYRRRLPIVTV